MYDTYRWNVSVDYDTRSLQSMKECLKGKDHYGCQKTPLINIDPSHIILDELHLMLRVTDILIRNLVWAMIELDLKTHHMGSTPVHLNRLLETISGCGLTFRVSHQFLSQIISEMIYN